MDQTASFHITQPVRAIFQSDRQIPGHLYAFKIIINRNICELHKKTAENKCRNEKIIQQSRPNGV